MQLKSIVRPLNKVLAARRGGDPSLRFPPLLWRIGALANSCVGALTPQCLWSRSASVHPPVGFLWPSSTVCLLSCGFSNQSKPMKITGKLNKMNFFCFFLGGGGNPNTPPPPPPPPQSHPPGFPLGEYSPTYEDWPYLPSTHQSPAAPNSACSGICWLFPSPTPSGGSRWSGDLRDL